TTAPASVATGASVNSPRKTVVPIPSNARRASANRSNASGPGQSASGRCSGFAAPEFRFAASGAPRPSAGVHSGGSIARQPDATRYGLGSSTHAAPSTSRRCGGADGGGAPNGPLGVSPLVNVAGE